jgi:serine/threonine protein kinase
MDYVPGGDLMGLLIKKGIFEEPLAIHYIGELVLAIESVHKMGFIHRDITSLQTSNPRITPPRRVSFWIGIKKIFMKYNE